MIKFKIFSGDCLDPADEQANKWIGDRPFIEVLDFKYQRLSGWNSSICIAYREITEVNHDRT